MVRIGVVLVSVTVTAGMIGLLQRWIGVPPLILFVVPIAVFLRVWGTAAALIAAVSGAVIGDFFFVEPTRSVTVYAEGLRLLLLLLVGTAVASLAMRVMPYRRH
jgi:K+-sensing histidine kinase KdpD